MKFKQYPMKKTARKGTSSSRFVFVVVVGMLAACVAQGFWMTNILALPQRILAKRKISGRRAGGGGASNVVRNMMGSPSCVELSPPSRIPATTIVLENLDFVTKRNLPAVSASSLSRNEIFSSSSSSRKMLGGRLPYNILSSSKCCCYCSCDDAPPRQSSRVVAATNPISRKVIVKKSRNKKRDRNQWILMGEVALIMSIGLGRVVEPSMLWPPSAPAAETVALQQLQQKDATMSDKLSEILLGRTSRGMNKKLDTFIDDIKEDINPTKADQIQMLRKLQSTDQEMLKKLDRELSRKDAARPLVDNLNRNLQEERRAIMKESGEREKLIFELQVNKISQVSLGISLLAFILDRQSNKRLGKEEEGEEEEEEESDAPSHSNPSSSSRTTKVTTIPSTRRPSTLVSSNDNGGDDEERTNILERLMVKADPISSDREKKGTIKLTKSSSSSSSSPSSSSSSSRGFSSPSPSSVLSESRDSNTASSSSSSSSSWWWWKSVRSWPGSVFTKAKGTIKKRINTRSGGESTSSSSTLSSLQQHQQHKVTPVRRRQGVVLDGKRGPSSSSSSSSIPTGRRVSMWGRTSTRVRQFLNTAQEEMEEVSTAAKKKKKLNDATTTTTTTTTTKIATNMEPRGWFGGTTKKKILSSSSSSSGSSTDVASDSTPSSIRVKILWKSAKTFWTWRQLSVVQVQIRGQLFLRLQEVLQDVVASTGLLEGVEEGLSNLITRAVARRLYANPVDQNIDYAYQILRGEDSGDIILLPKASEIEAIEKSKKVEPKKEEDKND
mmetsp:Transcript_20380/g.28308  ORF Transcript_20380/g.28308 Transcript_20380/m.28308 type:complete len:781 (-) Transcript_20380:134-2476(-)